MQHSAPTPLSAAERFRTQISDNHPVWDVLTKLVAPAGLVISAACYVSGYTFRSVALGNFGYTANSLEFSVQDTIVQGYPPLVLAIIALVLLLGAAALIAFLIVALRRKLRARRKSPTTSRFRISRSMIRYLNGFNAIMITLLIAVAAGAVAGAATARDIRFHLSEGCRERCFTYFFKSGQIHGIMLGGTKDRAIIVSRQGAYVVKLDDLKSARSYRTPPAR